MRKIGLLAVPALGAAILLFSPGAARETERDRQSLPRAPFRWPEGKKAALSLTFDDARTTHIETGLPLLDKHGVKEAFYVSPENVAARLEGWKKSVNSGHEIGNHTLTHPCTGNHAFSRENAIEDYTMARMAREIDGAGEAIFKMLGIRTRSFAYPCGQTFAGRGKSLESYVPFMEHLNRYLRENGLPHGRGAYPRRDAILGRAINLSVGVVDAGLGASFGIPIDSSDEEIEQAAAAFRKACED